MNSYFYLATLLALCIVPIVHLESVEMPTKDAVKGDTPVLETVEQPEAVIEEVVVVEEVEDVIITEEVEEEVVVVAVPVETIVEAKVDDVKIIVEKDPGMFTAILKLLQLI